MKYYLLFLFSALLICSGCDLTKKRVTKNNKSANAGNTTLDLVKDTDGDGLTDDLEQKLGTDPHSADTDGDGLSDGEEHNTYRTNPLKADTDDGGISDGAEIKNGTDPNIGSDDISNSNDTDGDGLDDQDEKDIGTDPEKSDTDGDGLSDGSEVNTYLTNPLQEDTDSGGASDGEEVNRGTNPRNDPSDDGASIENDRDNDGLSDQREEELGTDPDDADTDNDGATDGQEVNSLETDPLNPDTDNGGVSDGAEINSGTDPLNKNDDDTQALDSDADGLSDAQETILGTDKNNPDTDEDGLLDGAEVNTHNTDPLDEDTDNGGITDGDEINLGTDPLQSSDDFLKPILKILKSPKNKTTRKKATFEITTAEPSKVSRLMCALDGEEVKPCDLDTQLTFKNLELGRHIFQMTTVDILGRTSSVQYEWRIDQRVFKGCEGKNRKLQEISIEIPARTEACQFGEQGNLEKRNGYIQAQSTDRFEFKVGDRFDICEVEMSIESPQFKADDHFAFSWNDKVLISNGDFMLTTTPYGKTFDFEQIKGMKFSGESLYCFADGLGSSCKAPKHDTTGDFQIVIGEEDEQDLLNHLNKTSQQTLSLSVTGDNDSSDCQHSGLNVKLKVYKARVK